MKNSLLKPLFSIAFAALVLAGASTARAQTVTKINSWDEAGFTANWVAEGRIGNRQTNGTFESDLGANTASPDTQAQMAWTKGVAKDFTLTYGNGTATWNIDGQGGGALSYNVPAGKQSFNDLFIRAYAGNSTISINLTDLTYNNSLLAISTLSDDNTAAQGDALWLDGFNPSAGFTLTGKVTMDWTATAPSNSNLAFQIKAGNQERVPEPGSLALLTVAGLGLGATITRRRK